MILVVFFAFASFGGAAVAPSPTPSPGAHATVGPSIPTAVPTLRALGSRRLVLPPLPAVGPTFAPGNAPQPSGDIAGTSGPFVGLSLGDAVAMALVRNTDLAVSQSNRRIAAYDIVAARGAYDTLFQLQPQFQYQKLPSVSAFQSGPGGGPIQQITTGATGGFSGDTTRGGRYSLTTTAQRVDSNSTVNSYEPFYQTALALQITQPLARGTFDANRRRLELARVNADLSTDDALLQASQSVDNVLVAYYNLVAAWKNVAIAEDALLAADAQSRSNSRLVARGQSAPVDVVESDSQVDAFQDDVYSAIANVASLQNTLKALILNDPADPAWSANLVPTTPASTQIAEPKVEDLVQMALARRPEVRQLRENLRSANVNVAYAEDLAKPQLDLNLNLSENGFAGQPTNPLTNPFFSVIGSETAAINQLVARSNTNNPALPPLSPVSLGGLAQPLYPGTIGGLGQAYKTAIEGKFPQYTASLALGLPLRNGTAKANLAAERERRSAIAVREVALVQRVQSEARNAVQQYRSARSRLIAAAGARIAAEDVAASETRKFRAGQSTTFLVLQRDVTLANQRTRELQAQSDVQKALVEIDRVSGNILANNNVDAASLGTGLLPTTPSTLLSH